MKHLFVTIQTFAISIVVLAVITAGCSFEPKAFPPGTYFTTIEEADIPSSFPTEIVPIVVGNWELQFTSDGLYTVTKGGQVVVEGTYTSTADQIVMTDQKGQYACTVPPDEPTATYRLVFQDISMQFSTAEDNCPGRNLALTAHPLSGE